MAAAQKRAFAPLLFSNLSTIKPAAIA
jgi:hypothetical protein